MSNSLGTCGGGYVWPLAKAPRRAVKRGLAPPVGRSAQKVGRGKPTNISRGVESAILLGEKGAVPFVADLGKLARRCRQRIRDKREIAYGRCPFHLGCIANEFARKATAIRGWIVVLDLYPIVHPMPLDGKRDEARYRCRAAAE